MGKLRGPESEGNTTSADVQAPIAATFGNASDTSADVRTYSVHPRNNLRDMTVVVDDLRFISSVIGSTIRSSTSSSIATGLRTTLTSSTRS